MNKKLKIILVLVIIAVVAFLGIYLIIKNNNQEKIDDSDIDNGDNMATTMKAIVLKVNRDSLDVMISVEEENYVNHVMFAKEGNKAFKEGQEILIYYNANPGVNVPGQITDVGKVEIVKEESGVTIPDEIKQIFQNDDNNIEEQ